jgi:hypothetical protein
MSCKPPHEFQPPPLLKPKPVKPREPKHFILGYDTYLSRRKR